VLDIYRSNPEQLRAIMQMSAAMRGAGGSPFGMLGSMGGGSAFPAPGLPTTGGAASTTTAPPAFGIQTAGTPGTGAAQPATNDPFGMGDPAAMLRQMQQMQALFGTPGAGAGAGGAANPFGFGGFGAPPAAPADTRPPEERFQVQLQQLQDMGFSNAQQNVRALLATGGNVHSAIEYILGGGGL
jgi:ubiquilin